ncbi:hypothetical protein [Variovorax sp. dw_954]|nr:hypothetical protein [Variovorax sp. dw_954]
MPDSLEELDEARLLLLVTDIGSKPGLKEQQVGQDHALRINVSDIR